MQNCSRGLSGTNFVHKIACADCRERISYAKLLARIVGNEFRTQNCSRGLSGTNFVCKIARAGCRERISYAKLLARVVGNEFRMQNCSRGLSGTNFVHKIARADCRERILDERWCNNGLFIRKQERETGEAPASRLFFVGFIQTIARCFPNRWQNCWYLCSK